MLVQDKYRSRRILMMLLQNRKDILRSFATAAAAPAAASKRYLDVLSKTLKFLSIQIESFYI